ncbi:MAG: hypothetical protein A3J76_00640 [Candidatus Moranbacteria bacterium RBG_13_45_13]|nr:MAG: hypothetical protein A3J76_00640 [Candidatus Moranbacteria bacterium RBG_13_45_13]
MTKTQKVLIYNQAKFFELNSATQETEPLPAEGWISQKLANTSTMPGVFIFSPSRLKGIGMFERKKIILRTDN